MATAIAAADAESISLLQLCQISYVDPAAIPDKFPLAWPLLGGGDWSLAWGPALDPTQGNLAYVALCSAPGPSGPTGLSLAVVIRGTDFDAPLEGIWTQIVQDLDADDQQTPPWPAPDGALIAAGTADALSRVGAMISDGQSLVEFLADFCGAAANRQVPIRVTGHSLGGCVTTVLAPWLQWMLGQQGISPIIVPYTYAAPTAGNQVFAEAFRSAYPAARCYQNTLDIVPQAMAQLSEIPLIYRDVGPGLLAPWVLAFAIFGYAWWLTDQGASYAQIPDSLPLPGTWLTPDGDDPLGPWADEAQQQHDTKTYMALLGGTSVTEGEVALLRRSMAAAVPRYQPPTPTVSGDPDYAARLAAAAAKLRQGARGR